MLADLRALDTGRRALRQFGGVVGGVLVGIGGVVAWKSGSVAGAVPVVLLSTGGLLVLLGVAAPRVLRLPYLAWMALALALGFVMTRVVLTLVYLAVVTPIGLVMRALGHDPMHRRPDPSVDTYWIPRDSGEDPRERLTRYY